MATITITVPDSVVPRILNAYGSYVQQSDGTFLWTPVSQANFPAALKASVKAKVGAIEAQQATTNVSNEVW